MGLGIEMALGYLIGLTVPPHIGVVEVLPPERIVERDVVSCKSHVSLYKRCQCGFGWSWLRPFHFVELHFFRHAVAG